MSSNQDDLERGPRPQTTFTNDSGPATAAPQDGIRGGQSTSVASMDDRLSKFRYLVGIHNDPELLSTDKRPAINIGIYLRTVEAEKKTKTEYQIFSFLINGALGLQIIFAAALTALGAGKGPHGAVTAFGAMNTVLAGLLTFLKGSGLPNRMKYYSNEWTKVREYIEQREREFAREECELHLEDEVMVIERMYENVRKDIEANTPDSYVSMSSMRSPGTQPGPALSRLSELKDKNTEEKVMIMVENAAEKVMHARKAS